MDYIDILVIVFLLGLIYYFRLKGIIFFILLIILGVISGLILDVEIFGQLGKYIFLMIVIAYGAFLHFKCGTDLSKSVEGQGICIKRAFSQLVSNIRK
jgi:hypothetical protein